MMSLSDLIASITSYLPQIIIGMVILTVIVMVLLVFLTSATVKKALKKKAPPPPAPKAEPLTRAPEDKMPPRFGTISQILSLKGYFQVGDISLIFLKGMELLRQRLDTVNYKYHLPWYLLIGASQSGKSSMMDRADLVLPLGKPTFDIPDPNPGLRWWFLNRGVVLDVKGEFLVKDRGVQSDEKGWRTILSLLSRYRAQRPIDGIILTIPASELYGGHKLSPEELADRGKFLAQKLQATQNILSLRLPVYVVITKSDIIPGFQCLCQALPKQNQQNILGWSSPYTPTTAYTPLWLDEAFGHMHNQLSYIRLEMLAEGLSAEARDGVFIFPHELLHIQKNLASYVNQIFKVNAYDESLILRGIYLCGDSGVNLEFSKLTAHPKEEDLDQNYIPISEDEQASSPIITLDKIGEMENESHLQDQGPSKIFFVDDLLRQKIFFETGLAQPIHQRIISANRNLTIAKASMAGFIGISTFGLLHGYDRLTQQRDYLLPILAKINTILYQVPQTLSAPNRFSANMFDDQTRQLLDMMMNLHRSSFFSIFFPSSWLSEVDDNLRSALKVSYDQIIVRAVYMDLLLKARDLLTIRPKETDLTISLASQLQPVTTIEYQLMKDFVERFIELNRNVEKYNQLKDNSDPSILRDVVQYTLGINLPEEFLQNYEYFRRVLREVPYPKIDLKPYESTAQETLRILYNHFLSNLFSPQTPNSIVGKINFILSEFGQKQTDQLPNVEILRKISTDLTQSLPTIGLSGNNWIDGAFFDPGAGFADLMLQISQFPLFGPQLVEQFAKDTAISFSGFHEDLVRLNNVLVDRTQLPADKPIYPSQGLISLQKSLANLFNEPFMAPPPAEKISFRVPENQVIFWNPKLIDLAIEDVQKFDDFVTKHMVDFPPMIRETLKLSCQRNLQENLIGKIARAQTFANINDNLPSGQAAEQVLREKIANVREVAPKFVRLMEVMEKGHIGTGYVQLRELLGILSTRLLEQVEEVLNSYKLYQVKDDNFKWWDGKVSPILVGFNVRDEEDLKNYLANQRQLIIHFAMDYAEPMVTFLTARVMQEYQGNKSLVNKWKRIVDQVHEYEKRRPDNALTALENTLSKDLVHVNVAKCFKTIPLSATKSHSGDFFLEREVEIKRDLLSRCEVLKRQESIENYTKMANFFNDNLRGKFPFLTAPKLNMADAEPEDIREFFSMYKEAGDNPKAILDQVYQLGEMANAPLAFLQSMEEMKTFFASFLKGDGISDMPVLNFMVDFRVNGGAERNANLILEWFIKPDEVTTITHHDKKKDGKWFFGNEIVIGFRWPNESRLQPYRDKNQPRLQIEDQHLALFRFTSRWALLELIKSQSAGRGDFGGQADPQPYTLKFQIPNGPRDSTIVFNRIKVLGPSKGKTPGKPIAVPEFPLVAPELPEDITSKANDPVLVMGAAYKREDEESSSDQADKKEDGAKEGKKKEDQQEGESEEAEEE